MTVARNIWADLVDKRLWPIALLLVAALIAIPVLLVKSSTSTPKSPIAVAAAPGTVAGIPASLAGNPHGGPVGGVFKDPFKQQHVPAPAATSTTTSAAGPGTATAASTSSGTSSGTTTSSGSGSSGSSGGSSRESAPKAAPTTKLRVKFGPSDGQRPTRDIAAGTPLPTGANPLIVLLSIAKSGTASFLVSSDAQPQGDGRCEPNKTICASLFMKKGQTEFFDVTNSGRTVQYQLDVVGVVNG